MDRLLPMAVSVMVCLAVEVSSAAAQSPAAIANVYAESARRESPGFSSFSASRGESFFRSNHGSDWACVSCHGANPAVAGRHAKTGKSITPLAPAANPERFTSLATSEKWFKRNCNDVIGRVCTAQEKGDVLAYLMQVRP